jgi:membrane fusion protein (multidrug efflux system)
MTSTDIDRVVLPAPAPTLSKTLRKRLVLGALIVLLGVTGSWYGRNWWQVGRFFESTDDAYVGGDVTALSPHVAGFVSRILVADNQFVHAGDLLVELDNRDYQAKLAHAEAAVRRQKATLANLHAGYELQQAIVRQTAADHQASQASADFAHQEDVRYQALAASTAGSLQNYQKAVMEDRKAAAAVLASAAASDAARQRLTVIDTQIAEAEAGLAQAEADLHLAQLDLGFTEIRSPIDGYVGERVARVGAYATTGSQLLSVVPAQGLWVDANFKEDQLARMRPGQPATIVSDVSPGRKFTGQVLSLAPATGAIFSVIPPENATGNFTKIVQRVPVRIEVASAEGTLGLLRPGLSATVTVDTRPAAGEPQ